MNAPSFTRAVFGVLSAAALLAGCSSAASTSTPAETAFAQHRAPAKSWMPWMRGRGDTSGCPCLYVANREGSGADQGNITVYAAGANGDVTPKQNIIGPNTQLDTPEGVAVDSSGNIYVANEANDSVTVYAAGSTGNAPPIQTIIGSYTGLSQPFGIAIDPVNGDIYVANRDGGPGQIGSITIYPSSANGDWAPSGTITGEYSQLKNPLSVALDSQGNIYSTGSKTYAGGGSAILEYSAGSTGEAVPIRVIYNHGKGKQKAIDFPWGLTLDRVRDIYLANYVGYPHKSTVSVYGPNAKGGVHPNRRIAGTKTELNYSTGIAVDGSGKFYVANAGGPSYMGEILIFEPGKKKDVKPTYTITGPYTGLSEPIGIAIR